MTALVEEAVVVVVVVVVHEAEVGHVQEADLLKERPAVHVGHIHQRNPSPLHDHLRGGDQSLRGAPSHVLVHVHRHLQFFLVMYNFLLYCFGIRERQ